MTKFGLNVDGNGLVLETDLDQWNALWRWSSEQQRSFEQKTTMGKGLFVKFLDVVLEEEVSIDFMADMRVVQYQNCYKL